VRLINRFRIRCALRVWRVVYLRGWCDGLDEVRRTARPLIILSIGDEMEFAEEEDADEPRAVH
jgi:hypothetical protein